MALIHAESFDGVADIAQLQSGSKFSGAINGPVITAAGRTGQGISFPNANSRINFDIGSIGTQFYFGVAYKTPTLAGMGYIFHSLSQMSFVVESTGAVFADGFPGEVRTGTGLITVDTWNYIELRMLMANSGGILQIWINNVLQASLSSADTCNSCGANLPTPFYLHDGQSSPGLGHAGAVMDDLVLINTVASGDEPTSRLGVVKLLSSFPDGTGNISQGLGSDGDSVDNFALVDEQSINDTDYVEFSADDQKDLYTHSDITVPAGYSIYGVNVEQRAAFVGGTTKELAAVARLSGTEADGADKTLTSSIQRITTLMRTKPGGGNWSEADFNNAEFGPKQRPV